jgi:hypothetical protein
LSLQDNSKPIIPWRGEKYSPTKLSKITTPVLIRRAFIYRVSQKFFDVRNKKTGKRMVKMTFKVNEKDKIVERNKNRNS